MSNTRFANNEESSHEKYDLEVNELLSDCFKKLECSSSSFDSLEVIDVVCRNCVPALSLHTLESCVFSRLMPHISRLYTNLVKAIEVQLDVSQPDHNKVFQKLFSLLDAVGSCILHIAARGEKILSEYVYSLPVPTLDMSYTLFNVYKKSKAVQSAHILSEDFDELFNKASTLMKDFIGFWKTLIISSNHENEVQLLVEACKLMNNICCCYRSITDKYPLALLKVYINTLVKYYDPIKDKVDVSFSIRYLCDDVQKILDGIITEISHTEGLGPEQDASITQSLQMCSFYLKVIFTLCRTFQFYLGDCISSLFTLILSVYAFSPHCLLKPRLPKHFDIHVEKYLLVVIDPVLNYLVNEPQFISILNNYEEEHLFQNSRHHFSFCLMLLVVLEMLRDLPETVQNQLLFPKDSVKGSIIKQLFGILPKCDTELSLPIYLPTEMGHGKSHQMLSLYECICTKLCTVITVIPASYFSLLEYILVEELISTNIWQSLLAADVWTFLGRVESPTTCYHHCCFIAELCLQPMIWTSKWCILTLLRRLFNILALDHKKLFLLKYNFEQCKIYLHCDVPLENFFDERLEESVASSYVNKVKGLISGECETQTNSLKLIEMSYSLNLLARIVNNSSALLSPATMNNICELCTRLWSAIPLRWNKHADISIFLSGIMTLAECVFPLLNNTDIAQVVKGLLHFYNAEYDDIRIRTLQMFDHLVMKPISISQQQPETCSMLALFLSNTLAEKNVVILQQGLELFSEYSRVAYQESIITQCFQLRANCKERAKDFISLVPNKLPDEFNDSLSILLAQSKMYGTTTVSEPSSSNVEAVSRYDDRLAKEGILEIDGGISKLLKAVGDGPLPESILEPINQLLSKLSNAVYSKGED